MKSIVFSFIFVSVFFIAFCDGGGSSNNSKDKPAICSYTISGDVSGSYTGDTNILDGGATLNFQCDNVQNGVFSSDEKPLVTIFIKTTDDAVTPQTFDLSNSAIGSLYYVQDQFNTYLSDNTSTDCTATYTSSTEATFKCTNVPVDVGGGTSVTITNGTFYYK